MRVRFEKGAWSFHTNELRQWSADRTWTVGDTVTWTGSNDNIPKGAIGHVLENKKFGLVRCEFQKGPFNFHTNELRQWSADRTWTVGDTVTWTGSNDNIPEGAIGHVLE